MNSININRKKITKEEIENYKSFQSVTNSYNKIYQNPLFKSLWIKTSVLFISAGFVAVVAWKFLHHKDTPPAIEKTAFINPPIPQANVPYISIHYNAGSDTVINISKTSKIEIKQNSLVDVTGKPVHGTVEIQYRELMNPEEIFLSGIPMTYDSAGKTTTFQSAGMIELKAFQENNPLFIAQEKPIMVTFQSKRIENDYNVYYFDTMKQNWVYKGKGLTTFKKDKVQIKGKRIKNNSQIIKDSLQLIISAMAKLRKPVIPVAANPKKWHFTIDIVPKEFPELSVFKTTIFEIDETFKPLNLSDPKVEWNDIEIEKTKKPMYYYVTFTKDSLKRKYLACPVLNGKNYTQELKNYEVKFSDYQRELLKRRNDELRLKQQLERTLAMNKTIIEIRDEEKIVIRGFAIMNFGIWNYDKPISATYVNVIEPTIKVQDTVYQNKVYLANYSNNSIFTIYPARNISYDKKAKNMLWMVIDKNHVAVFTPDDFKKIPSSAKSYVFQFKKVNTPILSPEDFVNINLSYLR